MERASSTFLKTPTSTNHYSFATPPDSLMMNRFISPTPSIDRERSVDPNSPLMKMDRSDKMSLSKLLSPPESPETPHIQMHKMPPMSPPVHAARAHGSNILVADEPLLPVEGAELSLDTPLFDINEHNEALIPNVVKKRAPVRANSPTIGEYQLFTSCAWRMCRDNPQKYWEQEARYRNEMNRIRAPKPSTDSARYHPYSGSQRSAPAVKSTPVRAPRQYRPKPKTEHTGTSPTPQRVRHSAPNREDSNWQELPDICPDTRTLDGNSKGFSVEWRGLPLNLENEPFYSELHPAEAKLASLLRLTPAIYLSSKRRMFIGKLHRVQAGKEFRKTDAQKACAIDVNKASKLWTAFDKVGWLDVKHVQRYIGQQVVIPEHLRRHPAN